MKNMSAASARKAGVLLAVIMALALCACQPTPENPVVIGKDQERMLEKAAAAPSGAQVIPLP
jgi:hypothetical protein